MNSTTVAAVQMSARPLEVEHNLAQAGRFLSEAADEGPQDPQQEAVKAADTGR